MDENSTGKYPEGTLQVDDLTGIGDFTREDIATVTRNCVNRLGLPTKWEGLDAKERHVYLTLAANALAGKKVEGPIADLPSGNPQLVTQFNRMVLSEFRGITPKWNEEKFVAGFKPVYRTGRESTIGEEAHISGR